MSRKSKPSSGDKQRTYNFEDEANNPPPVPFDEALRRILKAKPQPKPTKKPGKKKHKQSE